MTTTSAHLLAGIPAETLEVARAQAFGRLTADEREDLLHDIAMQLPPAERALAGPSNAHPLGLARLLTRLGRQRPGLVDRLLSGPGGRPAGARLRAALLGGLPGGLAGGLVGGIVGGAAMLAVLSGDEPTGSDGTVEAGTATESDAAGEGDWLDGLLDGGGIDLI